MPKFQPGLKAVAYPAEGKDFLDSLGSMLYLGPVWRSTYGLLHAACNPRRPVFLPRSVVFPLADLLPGHQAGVLAHSGEAAWQVSGSEVAYLSIKSGADKLADLQSEFAKTRSNLQEEVHAEVKKCRCSNELRACMLAPLLALSLKACWPP